VSLKIFFSARGILLIEASFIVDQYQRSSVFGRWHQSLFVLLKPLFEVFGISGVKMPIEFTLKNVCIVHLDLKQFHRVKVYIQKTTSQMLTSLYCCSVVPIFPEGALPALLLIINLPDSACHKLHQPGDGHLIFRS
jgi:hypothetical protein